MRTLVIDTETSSLPNKNLPVDHPEQARILELAAIMLNDDLRECGVLHCYLAHDQCIIHPGAAAVHGITLEHCQRFGLPPELVCQMLFTMCDMADRIVAHNLNFDLQLVDIELTLGDMPRYDWKSKGFCTMLALTPICQLPQKNGRSGYKWPKVDEAVRHCFPNEQPTNLHSALADCRYAARLYRHLQGLKMAAALTQRKLPV